MAPKRSTACVLRFACAFLAAAGGFTGLGTVFAGAGGKWLRATPMASRGAFESGKVNLGVEVEQEVAAAPAEVAEYEANSMAAIMDCLEDECSVEALLQLEDTLADEEWKALETVGQLSSVKASALDEDKEGVFVWFDNFIDRSKSLRAQLKALQEVKDTHFVKQFVRAAAVAFGGGRRGDYPKTGASAYSESPV